MVLTQHTKPELKGKLKAAIFDMDGVITQTRDLHIKSWTTLFNDFLESIGNAEQFTNKDYNEYVDGLPRYDGVQKLLDSRNIKLPRGSPSDATWKKEDKSKTTVCALGNKKDEYFNEELKRSGAKVYDGTVKVIKALKQRGILLGVGSSSKNCKNVLETTGLLDLFDAVIDGVVLEEQKIPGKPKPDMFLRSLEEACKKKGQNISPELAMLAEDAIAGVNAGKSGNFGLVIGVNRADNRDQLAKYAHVVIDDFTDITEKQLDEWFEGQTAAK